MKPRTYLQARILEHLTILVRLLKIENGPDRNTNRLAASLTHLLRCYQETSTPTPDPLAPILLSAPKRKTHQLPPKKDVDPAGPSA